MKTIGLLALGSFFAFVGVFAPGGALLPAMQEPPAIDHDPISCAVEGESPEIGAVVSSGVGIGAVRLFFKAVGQTDWYYLEMPLQPAPPEGYYYTNMPKPLPGTQFEYYVLALDTDTNPTQTGESVVTTTDDCDNDLPFGGTPLDQLNVIPTVPGQALVPPGFAPGLVAGVGTGLGTGAIIGIVGGAATIATVPIITSSGDDDEPTTTTAPGVTTTTTVATTTTTTTTTTLPSQSNSPPNLRYTISPEPANGDAPLNVNFSMCGSIDPDGDGLRFRVNWGDGGGTGLTGNCSFSHTYAAGTYTLTGCVTDSINPEVCATEGVKANAPPYPIGAQRRLTWISVLDAPGALGQVVVNGTQVSYPAFGRSHGVADLSSSRLPGQSEIRVEAQVVAADGPGTWEFSFRTHEGRGVIQPGSLRVIAGEVVALTQDGVVFRVKGQPGERLVFGAASR